MESISDEQWDGCLAFLDVLINYDKGNLYTSVYRKSTFTGLGIKLTSHLRMNYKRNIITNFAAHAFQICSNYQNIHSEQLVFLRNIFWENNSFPFNFLEFILAKKIYKLFTTPTKVCIVSKMIFYMSLT